jgi:hypothetical protein
MYEGTDRVIDTISEMVKLIRLGDGILQKHNRTTTISGPIMGAASGTDFDKNSTWKTLLLQHPHVYGQFITGLDVSLSQGRRLQPSDIRCFLPQLVFDVQPTLTPMMPMIEENPNADDQQEQRT